MTIRSGSQAIQNQRLRRGQTLCTVFRLQRNDGFILRFTDHDRPITISEDLYLPIGLGTLSAERREAGLRSGNQEASGVVDGVTITIPDLLGYKYRGAIVTQQIVDWRMPWIWHYRSTKRIVEVKWDGSTWRATLGGFAERLQQPVAGRFGGYYSTTCPYTLGDPDTCRADISDGILYGVDATSHVTIAGTSAIKLVQTGAAWTVDAFVGWLAMLTSGTLAGESRLIASNTADTLVLASVLPDTPSVASGFDVGQGARVQAAITEQRMILKINTDDIAAGPGNPYANDYFRDGEMAWVTGLNAGLVSPIVKHNPATAEFTLLIPTAFDFAAGDRVIVRVGCDGLLTTCKAKFANQDNFGGDPYAPGASRNFAQPVEP